MAEVVTFAGTECRSCAWKGADIDVTHCPSCGHALAWWATDVFSLVGDRPYSRFVDYDDE